MARLSKELPFRWQAILCAFGVLWFAVEIHMSWGGGEGLAGVSPMAWWSGPVCAFGMPFFVVEYRQRRWAERTRQAAPLVEEESHPQSATSAAEHTRRARSPHPMGIPLPAARWPVLVPAVALLFGVVWAVLTRVAEGRINPLATYWICLWVWHLTVGVVTYRREHRESLAHRAAPAAEEKPAP
ncbi:hypothetical protein [Nocardiopsis sp. CA-288880]|uniref:hypothetical protein n=1 Tax=Nocardiopsis sp. CA-288880 TaxID=3239995 RepID=UPI003D97965F